MKIYAGHVTPKGCPEPGELFVSLDESHRLGTNTWVVSVYNIYPGGDISELGWFTDKQRAIDYCTFLEYL